jgi:hypothetical protein
LTGVRPEIIRSSTSAKYVCGSRSFSFAVLIRLAKIAQVRAPL